MSVYTHLQDGAPVCALDEQQRQMLEGMGMRVPSPREIEVMQRIASSWHTAEIAHDLQISTKTVDTHRGTLLKSIGGRTNACIVRLAIRIGLPYIQPPRDVRLPANKKPPNG